MTTASAPAKILLLGEHTALYGNPVLAATLDIKAVVSLSRRRDKETYITAPSLNLDRVPLGRYQRGERLVKRALDFFPSGYDIRITSEIPIASGLGSSAAVSVALVSALAKEHGLSLPKEEIARIATECESMVHGQSSGVDTYTVAYGGVVLYQNYSVRERSIRNYPSIVMAHSGIESETIDLVSKMEHNRQHNKSGFETFLSKSKALVLEGLQSLLKADWKKMGELMNQNQDLLRQIGVSHERLEELISAALDAGAYGAKLTGAGGGGVVIALVDENSRENVSKALIDSGGKIIDGNISGEGVMINGK